MKFCISTQGTRIAYQMDPVEGSIPLVLLHGFCEDHSLWDSIRPFLRQGIVLTLDLPGFGASELPENPDMAEYANAVLSVLDHQGLDRCVLVGHSIGGYIALEFASLWPDRLAGFGLFHSHPYEDSDERKTARLRGIETLQAGKRDLYVSQLFPNLFAQSFSATHPEVINQLIVNGKQQSPEGISAALQAMISRRDHQTTLQKDSGCPVLFLLGAQDTLVPAQQGMKAALLPRLADIHLLSEVAHMGMYENTRECADIVNSFWDFCTSIEYS